MAQATWDSGKKGTNLTLSGSDLIVTHDSGSDDTDGVASNHAAITSGKYYWEVTYNTVANNGAFNRDQVGIVDSTLTGIFNNELATQSNAWMFCSNGNKRRNGTPFAYGNSWSDGDIIGVAWDDDNSTLWFSINGTWQNGATITNVEDNTDTAKAAYNSVTVADYIAAASVAVVTSTQGQCTLEAVSGDLTYTVPTGFTAGLPDAQTNDGAVSMGMGATGTGTLPIHSAGAVSIGMGATGAGSLAIRANGAVGAGAGADGTGTVSPIHGNGAVSLNPNATGTGIIPVRGSGGVSLNLSVVATGSGPLRATGAVALGMGFAGTGTTYPNFIGATTLPLLTVAATGISAEVATADNTFPALTVSATGFAGTALFGNVVLPKLQAIGYGGTEGAVTLPLLEAAGVGLTGHVAVFAKPLPPLAVTGEINFDGTSDGVVLLPKLVATGTVIRGTVSSFAGTLPTLQIIGTAFTGELLTATFGLPKLAVVALAVSDGLLDGAVTLPQFVVTGYVVNGQVFTTTAWSVNTENYAAANYVNFDFHTLGQIGGQNIGISSTGIYVLSGCDDDGTLIDAEFLTGFDDFGLENEKNVDKAYLGYTADGDLVLLTNVDGEEKTRVNDVTHQTHDSGLKRARVNLGKGVRSRYWQAGLRNCNGADFEIEELGLLYRQLSRKI